jgi:hypothetical protein
VPLRSWYYKESASSIHQTLQLRPARMVVHGMVPLLLHWETKDFNTTLVHFIENIMFLKVEGFFNSLYFKFLSLKLTPYMLLQ